MLDKPETHQPEINTSEFIAEVGARVRRVRKMRGISRRILSERSGISQRYLAQLELGSGNISIALLLKVAVGLGEPIESFIINHDSFDDDDHAIALFKSADEATKQQVLAILDPEKALQLRGRRIALIGLRGAGKSTLGAIAGTHLQTPFMELNDEIERSNGMSVNETIELYGQEGYRLLERQAIEHIATTQEQIILAVAGGIVSEPETFNYLLRHYHTIWIKAAPEEHMDRVLAQGDERPMAGNPQAFEQLRQILTSREALYQKASTVVDTTGASLHVSTQALLNKIETKQFLA
ncbi:MAG: helix-turn-helix transcriptional regulator [Hyphomicrobiales bacterium]